MLGAGSAIVFIALGCYVTLVDTGVSNTEVKLAVDAGVLAISLGSILIGRPFTLQYAREVVDAETAQLPGFRKANYVSVGVDRLLRTDGIFQRGPVHLPGLPLWIGIAIAFAARNTAIYFTKWYPEYRRTKFATPIPGASTP